MRGRPVCLPRRLPSSSPPFASVRVDASFQRFTNGCLSTGFDLSLQRFTNGCLSTGYDLIHGSRLACHADREDTQQGQARVSQGTPARCSAVGGVKTAGA